MSRLIEKTPHLIEVWEYEPRRYNYVEEFLEANVSEPPYVLEQPETPQLPCRCSFSDCRKDHGDME